MKKYIPYIIIVILLVLLLASLQECNRRSNLADTNLQAITDTVIHYKNRLGTITASKQTLHLDKKQLQDIVIKKDSELAALSKEFVSIKSVLKIQTVTKFDTIQITYKDTVKHIFDRTGKVSDDWYSFSYNSNQYGVKIDSFRTWTSAIGITGIKRNWFLGSQTVKTDITLSNPHMTVTNLTAVEVVVPSPWYRKWYIWLATGIVGGILIGK